MAMHSSIIFFAFIVIPILCNASSSNVEDMKTYIVYMGSLPEESSYSPTSHHMRMLQHVTDETDAISPSLIRSYQRSFNGFAAKLTEEQREKIAQMEEVVSVFESQTLRTQTTRSWEFIGLADSSKRNETGESDVIIGFVDTGIWPESESFTDKGYGPPPKKWKGTCAGGKNFKCNNKIIGARYYLEESARDGEGHGSHLASIAAGNKVNGVSFYGLAEGIARGGVPSARIAVYKPCDNQGGCGSYKVLAALDDAIADGVDILAIGLGGPSPPDTLYDDDVIGIGSFHAMTKGILTVQDAGNVGPDPGSVISVAPWVITVGASTMDRKIIDKVVLGNGTTLVGDDIVNTFDNPNGTKYPIAKCKDSQPDDPCVCSKYDDVKGKIALCHTFLDRPIHDEGGAVGEIVQDTGGGSAPSGVTYFPYLTLSEKDWDVVLAYSISSENPEAEIMKSEAVVDNTAPKVASFSGRGPNIAVSEILKPDITAPGVNILSAFSLMAAPSWNNDLDPRRVKYNFLSGSSLSCAHVSGIAAYVKSFHPDWSPAAIKSAIMTTAKPKPMNSPKNNQICDDNEFAHGSGHVNPLQAIDPGLFYDLSKQDYIQLLCNLGYNISIIQKISGDRNITCPKSSSISLIRNTNVPSILVEVPSSKPFNIEINRTVTNVGFASSKYNVTIQSSPGVNITVEPKVLSFKSLSEEQSFVVRIAGGALPEGTVSSSSLVWSDGTHNVRSPVVIHVVKSTRAY